MEVRIRNCNNIDEGVINIIPNKLNIKYAANGTGKSTVVRAIALSVRENLGGASSLNELTPFKCLNVQAGKPAVEGVEEVKNLRVFDESYINDFVFQPDELVKGSFDIFIRDKEYEAGMEEISVLTREVKGALVADPEILELISDLQELSSAFGKPVKNGFHASSNVAKAFKAGNKVASIPKGLEKYTPLIQHDQNYRWIKWQQDGKAFLDISTDCPYCTHSVKDTIETINLVSECYEPKSIESLSKTIAVFSRLDKYFSPAARQNIESFVKNIEGYTDAQAAYIREVWEQIGRLADRLVRAQNFGFSSFRNVERVIEELNNHKIDLELYVHLNSATTAEKIQVVNKGIDGLLERAGKLQGCVVKQKRLIEKLVKSNSSGINDFLRNAGYSYSVKLVEDGEIYRLKLMHNSVEGEVANVRSHLSYGERNAFSLVLFMYDCLKSEADLIVLDDPISSFDKNKKYAIVEALFRKEKNSFRDKTVLLLTHDFEPVVDMMLHHPDRFVRPAVFFLENQLGNLTEKAVERKDIQTFIEIAMVNAKKDCHEINRLVYLRRYYEVIANKQLSFDVLSSLFHKRQLPTKKGGDGEHVLLTDEELLEGTTHIQRFVDTFEYNRLVELVRNDARLKELYYASKNNYEKLHIYRMLFDDKSQGVESDVIRKFINEAFHIENNYIYQLSPSEYQLVPQYVIDECDLFVQGL
ncbi:AAA family ATPase [Pseudomonas kermanshahensis]|uniref:AAA family ATPase n=1 Tax=Pseudomonas kermanshahensis TaxID=2745482 RepID=A0ABU8R6Y0_9PSED